MSLGWFLKNRPDKQDSLSRRALYCYTLFLLLTSYIYIKSISAHVYIFIIYVYLKELYLHNWALSIQPKFRKFRSETRWNGPFLLGPTQIFGTTFEGHRFDRSAHFGRVDGPFHLT